MTRSCAPCGVSQPCWEPPPDICPPCLDLDNEEDAAAWQRAWANAVSHVYECTCHRFPGKCWAEIVRPCVPSCCCPPSARDCRCGRWEAINLCNAFCMPLCEILGVVVNGEIWDEPWRLENLHYSAPCMPGADCGPFLVLEDCTRMPIQNIGARLGNDCTWAIIARTGCEPPVHLWTETARLALEMLKLDPQSCAYSPDTCQLSDGVTQMSRKGMTVQFEPGATGLPILDKAIKKWECCETDNESAMDPSAEQLFHSQWVGHLDDLDAAIAAIFVDPVELPDEPVPVPHGR